MTSVSSDRRQGVNAGAAIKVPCRVATTAAIVLSGLQTVDGVALASGDRVLVKNQATQSENGIWNADTGNWSRALDFDGPFDVVNGTLALVLSGGAGQQLYEVTTADPITPGSSSITWTLSTATFVYPFNTITTIAALKALAAGAYASVQVLGYYAAGDGGGGVYRWNGADATADNGGTVIAPNAGAGRWNLVIENNSISALQFGAKTDGTDSAAYINAWTAAIKGVGIRGTLPSGTIVLHSNWNSASNVGAGGTNNGLWIEGAGVSSKIKFVYAVANTGIGWDLTGACYTKFKGFTVLGGNSAADCPQCAVLLSAAETGGGALVFSGLMTWEDVKVSAYGDYAIVNQGCEQVDYFNCECYGQSAAGTAVPFVYVAGGSARLLASPNVTARTPVASMTAVHWHGQAAVQSGAGARIVIFHFTAAGGIENIRHDGYTVVAGAAANPFILMGDDTGGAIANTYVQHCGMVDAIVESSGTTGNVIVCKNETTGSGDWNFRGRCSIGVALLDVLFQFTNDPYSGSIEWLPNEVGAWSGAAVVQSPSGGGLRIATSVPAALNAVFAPGGDNFAISGFHNYTFIGQGTDFLFMGAPLIQGPVADGQMNLTELKRAGARVSGQSDYVEAVQTTQNVTGAGATAIAGIISACNKYEVTGNDGAGKQFWDTVATSGTAVIGGAAEVSRTIAGAPDARAYSIAAGSLKLVMAANTYDIQVIGRSIGIQG